MDFVKFRQACDAHEKALSIQGFRVVENHEPVENDKSSGRSRAL
jgi:hypothetical protein